MKLSSKIIIYQTIIVVIIMFIFGFFLFNDRNSTLHNDYNESIILRGKSLSKNLVQHIWNVDEFNANEVIAIELEPDYMLAITVDDESFSGMIKNKNGEVVEYSNSREHLDILETASMISDVEVIRNKNVIATITIYTTDRYLTKEIRGVLLSVILLGIIVIVVLSIVLSILVMKLVQEPLEYAVSIATDISKGDLTHPISIPTSDEVGQLLHAMKVMQGNLHDIVGKVTDGTKKITIASNDLEKGNTTLQMRTEQQAVALEETAAAIEEMNSSIRSNADNTVIAKKLSNDVNDKTKEGLTSVNNMISSMDEISEFSSRISQIIDVINNIAFQTNLLALNASIEAARAGEKGKGFAVVAVEVRKLAKKSDKSASEISSIIKSSLIKISEGVEIADNAGVVLNDINKAVNKVTNLITEISSSSQEQLTSADQIDRTITKLDNNTQENSLLAEEATESTKELSLNAVELDDTMKFFKIQQNALVEV